jgi:hypothetical protein
MHIEESTQVQNACIRQVEQHVHFLERFRKSDPDYIDDDKWWLAAQEADKDNASRGAGNAQPVDSGATPSDDIDDYGPTPAGQPQPATPSPAITPARPALETTSVDVLLQRSREIISWSGAYSYSDAPPLSIKYGSLSPIAFKRKAMLFLPYSFRMAFDCDFFYDPRHGLFASYPIDPRQMLLAYLAEKFKARDRLRI